MAFKMIDTQIDDWNILQWVKDALNIHAPSRIPPNGNEPIFHQTETGKSSTHKYPETISSPFEKIDGKNADDQPFLFGEFGPNFQGRTGC